MTMTIGSEFNKENLVLYLDAQNSKSYTSGSDVWWNLVGENSASRHGVAGVYDNKSIGITGDTGYFHVSRSLESGLDFYTDDFSMSIWVKFNSFVSYLNHPLTTWNTGASSGTNEWFLAASSGGNIYWTVQASNLTSYTVSSTDTPILINEFCEITMVKEDTTIKVYYNGIEKDTETNVALATLATSSSPFYIGGFRGNAAIPTLNSAYVFSGSVGSVRVWKRALTDDEIQQNYLKFVGRY